MSAASAITPPSTAFAYAPVSPVRLYMRRDEAGPRVVFNAWLLMLGPMVASGLLALLVSAMPLEVQGNVVHLTLYLPLVFATLWAIWFGYWWGAVPLFVSQVVLALAAGIGPGWALVLGLADPLGLGVLVLAFQAAPVSTSLRTPAALVFFVVIAFVSVLTSSAGAFVWSYAMDLSRMETLATWQGWWLGSLLQDVLIVAPILIVASPWVERWKREAGLEPHRPATLSPGRIAFAFSVVLFGLAGYVLLVRYFGWTRLGPIDAMAPEVVMAFEGLDALQWITFAFIGLVGYFGYQVARGWIASANELAEANRQLKEVLAEREMAQARLVEFAVEQEQSSKAKDTFFSVISHDLRGPMGALLGLTEVAETRLDHHMDRELVEMAGLMHRSAEYLYTMLINLLEWARLQTGQMRCRPEWIDVNELATETVELLALPASEKSVWLHNRTAPGTLAWADPTMIRSVLLNLVGNGMKFTPEGGTVTVRAEEAGGRLAVSVEDTGVGMSASDVAKLFHLEKARSRNGTAGERGSGLGLILCKEMVERHGGTMAVESTKGEGSRFRFTLPLTPEDGPPEVETEGIEEAA